MTQQTVAATTLDKRFSLFASQCASLVGSPYTFLFSLVTIVVWVLTGPIFHFSDAWQLIINSWTNIVTFLVVFVIQNTQNRDTKALNLKLDELIRSIQHAEKDVIAIEKLSDPELEQMAKRYERIREQWEQRQRGLKKKTG